MAKDATQKKHLHKLNPLKKTKLIVVGCCSTTLFSLLSSPSAFAGNPVEKCKPITESVIAMYLIPTNWNPSKKLSQIVKNRYWGAPKVPVHITLTGFALPSNSKKKISSGCKKHNESMSKGVRSFNNKISHSYHIGHSNWGKPEVSEGSIKYVKYPLVCKSKSCFSLLKSALKLNSEFVGFVDEPTKLHVSFDNLSAYKNQDAIKKLLGGLKWKACKVEVKVSGHNSKTDPGKGLKIPHDGCP